LLTHTSGLDSFGWDDLAGDWKPMDKSAAVDGILQQPLRHPPDSTFSYTNSGYVLLAAIVERVSGKSFQAFVQDRLLRPAGLANTRFGWNTSGHVRTAKGYSGEIERGSYLDRPHSWLRVGPADAMATVDDLYQWVRALQTHRVLPATMVSEMFSIQRQIEPGYGYGYGWWVRADRDRKPTVIFHAGDFPGFHSEVRWYPADDITVIAATNQEFRGASITEPLLNGIVDVLRGRPSPLPEVAVRTTASGRVSGSWVTPDGSGVIITTTDTGLRVEPIGQTIVDLLSGADPSGTETRRADGARTVDLVLELKHDGAGAYAKALADDVKADLAAFEAEWRQLTDAYGVLLSVQLLGTIPGETALQSRSLVRLKFERATMLMSYAWKDGRLLSTQPRARPEIEPLAFGLEQNGSYAAFDWISGATIHLHPDSGKLTLIASPSRSVTLVRHNP
jgi:CubicO group peptidase (beta-lactamase class C family)